MAIKYNGRDLVKRIINGKEVEKVMYNGVQIRPSGGPTPPTPSYHIMGDFATAGASGQLPSGWSAEGNYTLSSNGITSNTDFLPVYILPSNFTPDFSWVTEIDVSIGFTITNDATLSSYLVNDGGRIAFEGGNELITYLPTGLHYTEQVGLVTPYTGTLTTVYDLFNKELRHSIGNNDYLYILKNTDCDNLRDLSSYYAGMYGGTPLTINNVDVYLWNTNIKFNEGGPTTCQVGDLITLHISQQSGLTAYTSVSSGLSLESFTRDDPSGLYLTMKVRATSAGDNYVAVTNDSQRVGNNHDSYLIRVTQ